MLDGILTYDHPPAPHSLQNAIVLQILVCPCDCVGIDGQLLGQVTNAGQHLPLNKNPVRDRQFYLSPDLLIHRHITGGIDIEKHRHLFGVLV